MERLKQRSEEISAELQDSYRAHEDKKLQAKVQTEVAAKQLF